MNLLLHCAASSLIVVVMVFVLERKYEVGERGGCGVNDGLDAFDVSVYSFLVA